MTSAALTAAATYLLLGELSVFPIWLKACLGARRRGCRYLDVSRVQWRCRCRETA